MTKLAVAQARKEFAEVMNRSAYSKERIVITKNNKEIVAVVPIEDLQLLEEMEDQLDLREAREASKRAKKSGTVPWNEARKALQNAK